MNFEEDAAPGSSAPEIGPSRKAPKGYPLKGLQPLSSLGDVVRVLAVSSHFLLQRSALYSLPPSKFINQFFTNNMPQDYKIVVLGAGGVRIPLQKSHFHTPSHISSLSRDF